MTDGTCETCRFYAPDTNEEVQDVDGKRIKVKVEAESGGCHYNTPKEYLLASPHPSLPPTVLGVWPRVNARFGWCRLYERDEARVKIVDAKLAALAAKKPDEGMVKLA